MIVTGQPAKETELGKKVNQQKEVLLQETRDWLRGWIPYCTNSREFAKRYTQILRGLTDVVTRLYNEALKDFEPIAFLYNCLNYCNLNPADCIGSIKYCSLYLESIYNDIYFELLNDTAKQQLTETVKPAKQRKVKKAKEQLQEEKETKEEQWQKEMDPTRDDGGL